MFFKPRKPIESQIEVFMNWCFKVGNRGGTWRHWLDEFVRLSETNDIYDIDENAVRQFLSDISVFYRGDHQLIQAEKAIRNLLKFYSSRARKLNSVSDYDTISKMKAKTKRNEDLVKKRLSDPEKWTWGELGEFFGIDRYTARDLFYRHENKYSKEQRV